MAREAQMWQWLQRGLGPHGHFVRVENVVAPGTPDVNYALRGGEGWIELKSVDALPVRATTPLFARSMLRPEQIEWLAQRAKHGGTAYIAARAAQHFFLLAAHVAPRFNAAPIDLVRRLAVFEHVGRMREADWAVLGGVLAEKRQAGERS